MTRLERYSKKGSIPPKYIEIKESNIPGAGKGAFALQDLKADKTIGEYLGIIYTGKDMENTSGDYLFSVRKNGREVKIIDGADITHSSWVRFVNTSLENGDGNVRFFQYNQRIFLRTTKPIHVGDELIGYYGDDYVNIKIKNIEE